MHSLLSRTTFQHLSGTRGALDFVEVPSHLFEYFAQDPSLLRKWSEHHESGHQAPVGLFEEVLANRSSLEALETQAQLLYSLSDQYIYGPQIGSVQDMSDIKIYKRAMEGTAALQLKYTPMSTANVELLQGDNVHTPSMYMLSHTHLLTYGGHYYSYLYAKMYAAQI